VTSGQGRTTVSAHGHTGYLRPFGGQPTGRLTCRRLPNADPTGRRRGEHQVCLRGTESHAPQGRLPVFERAHQPAAVRLPHAGTAVLVGRQEGLSVWTDSDVPAVRLPPGPVWPELVDEPGLGPAGGQLPDPGRVVATAHV